MHSSIYPVLAAQTRLPFYLSGAGISDPEYHVVRPDGLVSCQILFTRSGSGVLRIDGREIPQTPGSLFFLTPGVPHEYFPDGGGTLVGEERRLTVYEGETVAQAVVKALTERPLDSYADLYPLLPEGFTALNASTEEGICYLNLPGSVAALLPEDAEAQNRMIQGLVDSLCSLEDVTQVQLMLDGEYQLMLGSVPISRPILPTGGVQPMAE